jgi:hypothetical protein
VTNVISTPQRGSTADRKRPDRVKEAKKKKNLSENVGPIQKTLTKVNHKVTQRTKLIHDLPQTRCVLRCRVKSICSEPGHMCVYSVLSTDIYFQVRQARRRYTRLRTAALVNQLILRLIKCPNYPRETRHPSNSAVYTNDVDSSAMLVTPVSSRAFRQIKGENADEDLDNKLAAWMDQS